MLCLSSSFVNCVSFKPDNPNIVVSGSSDKTIKTWDITSGSCLSTLNVDGRVDSIDFAPCGNKLAVACNNFRGNGSFSVKIFSKEGSTGNLVCQSTLRGHRYVLFPNFSFRFLDLFDFFNQICYCRPSGSIRCDFQSDL